MALEFSADQKNKVLDLTKRGFSEDLAAVAIAAEIAGLPNATEKVAAIVRALTKAEAAPNAAEVQATIKRLQTELDALKGRTDMASIQRSISIKNQITRLKQI